MHFHIVVGLHFPMVGLFACTSLLWWGCTSLWWVYMHFPIVVGPFVCELSVYVMGLYFPHALPLCGGAALPYALGLSTCIFLLWWGCTFFLWWVYMHVPIVVALLYVKDGAVLPF